MLHGVKITTLAAILDWSVLELVAGDLLLLCTDGLSEKVKREEMVQAFRTRSLPDAVTSLIALANDRGGDDNITLLAARVEE